jgi:Pyridoxamine 5'-phosphate oxidase
MTRIVGNRLRVNVGRKPEEEQIVDLRQLFNENPNRVIVVAGSVSADGAPNTCPVTLIYAKDDRTLLLGLLRNSNTSANLSQNGRVVLQIIGPNDLVMGIAGSIRLLKDPMDCSPAMAIWEMLVDKVKQDTSPAQRVTQGPAAEYRSEKSEAFGQAAFAELQAVAHAGS